jgi:thioredoxin
MIELNSETFDQHTRTGSSVIDFWAEWCGPCKTLAPAFSEVATKMADAAVFAKVDVDAEPDLAKSHSVLSVPTVVVLRDGVEVGRLVGARGARQLGEELEALLS